MVSLHGEFIYFKQWYESAMCYGKLSLIRETGFMLDLPTAPFIIDSMFAGVINVKDMDTMLNNVPNQVSVDIVQVRMIHLHVRIRVRMIIQNSCV